jgi:hypothetical protein
MKIQSGSGFRGSYMKGAYSPEVSISLISPSCQNTMGLGSLSERSILYFLIPAPPDVSPQKKRIQNPNPSRQGFILLPENG